MNHPTRKKKILRNILGIAAFLCSLLTLVLLVWGTPAASRVAVAAFILMTLLALLSFWATDLRAWRIDRMFAESPGRQLLFAVAVFLFTLEAVAIVGFQGNLYKCFVDVISPISLRGEAYPNEVRYVAGDDYSRDSARWTEAVTVMRDDQPDALRRRPYLRFLMAYLLGLVVFSGLLIATVNRIMATRAERYRKGSASYRFRNHYLILGGNDMVQNIISQIWQCDAQGNPVVVVVTGKPVEEYRKYLYSELNREQRDHTVILAGNMVAKELLSRLRIAWAREIFVLGDDSSLTDESHDMDNMQCTRNIVQFLPDRTKKEEPAKTPKIKNLSHPSKVGNFLGVAYAPRPGKRDVLRYAIDTSATGTRSSHPTSFPIPCYVLFEYQSTFTAFQYADFFSSVAGKIKFLPYNFYENCVQKVFVRQSPYVAGAAPAPYLPIERDCMTEDSDDFVHLVVIGMTRMGFAMAVQAAQIAHYPNFNRNRQCRTRITLIDEQAARMMQPFMQRYQNLFDVCRWRFMNGEENPWNEPLNDPSLGSPYCSDDSYLGQDFIDIEWEFVEGSVSSPYIQGFLKRATADPRARVTIAACLDNPTQSAAAALYMSRSVRDRAVQILVYQRSGNALIDSISSEHIDDPTYRNVYPFGTVADGFDYLFIKNNDRLVDTLMEQYNRMYNKTQDRFKDLNPSYLMKTGVVARGKSRSARRWSNYYLANTTWGKLRSAQSEAGEISAEVLDSLAETEHNRWVVEQLLLQFRPLTRQEQTSVGALYIQKEPYRALSLEEQRQFREANLRKERLKGEQMAHLDICSFERLKEIDNYVVEYDYGFVRIIPDIVREINQGLDATYRPAPFTAPSGRLRPDVRSQIEPMARRVHEGWMEGRVGEGWRYGAERSYEQKLHPHIVDYDQLPESEKDYDREMAQQTLLLIGHLGYKLVKKTSLRGRKKNLSVDLSPLVERLAENNHEVWVMRRRDEGWRYGPRLDEARRQHPNMIPYAYLPQSERNFDRRTARRTLNYIQSAGFIFLSRRNKL